MIRWKLGNDSIVLSWLAVSLGLKLPKRVSDNSPTHPKSTNHPDSSVLHGNKPLHYSM